MIKGLVSIISPCYNGEKYLENFLESVLSQTYEKIELIVINDGSNDDTATILERYKARFIERGYVYRYYYQENKGQAAAINVGLSLYQGEYLMWVDSDDILLKNNVRRKVDFLKLHQECDMVVCEGEIVDGEELNVPIGVLKRKKPKGADKLFEDLIFERNVVYGPAAIMTKQIVMKKVLPNNHIYESLQGQNWQLMLPLAYSCRCGYLEECLFKCVAHADSHSRIKRSYEEELKRYDDFTMLLVKTIETLVDMPIDEKKYWISKINEKYNFKKLQLAYSQNNFEDSRSVRKVLESYTGKKVWQHSYLRYLLGGFMGSVVYKIKIVCKSQV